MAIAPKDMYPSQVAVGDPNYPAGKAQNVVVVGDGSGTPWEKTIVNERFGFEQALLRAAGMTENGVPESVAASQYLDAIRAVIADATDPISDRVTALESSSRRPGFFSAPTNQVLLDGALVKWAETNDPAGAYSLSSDGKQLHVTRDGLYWVQATLNFGGISGLTEGQCGFYIRRDILTFAKAAQYWSNDIGQNTATVTVRALVDIPDHTNQRVNIQIAKDDPNGVVVTSAFMSVEHAY